MDFICLRKNLKREFKGLKKNHIALLGDSSTQLLHQAIRGYGYEVGYDIDIFEADYDQIDRQVFDPSSNLYQHTFDFVIIVNSSQKLLKKFYSIEKDLKPLFATSYIEKAESTYHILVEKLNCRVIYFNFPEINDTVFGNFSSKIDLSFLYQLRKINYELMNLSQKLKNLFISDISSLQNQYGQTFVTDNKVYVTTDNVFSLDFLPFVAKNTVDIIQSVLGQFKKCLILDLDNTTWGGIIGDDGIENIQIGDLGIGKAFTDLQLWAKQLKERGVILAICSKNSEDIAREPFEKHPDMKLRLEDISVFVANWENKADNVMHIQSILNIGFDSMVFLDDNPFERNLVRTAIPQITVPELPEDPADYLPYLRTLNLFETASFSENDTERTKQYQEEEKRVTMQKSFTSEDEFLQSLNMISLVSPFNKFNTPRVAQLSQRSNQFNLRTERYTEKDVVRIGNSSNYHTLTFDLKDKYGVYGLISTIVLCKQEDIFFIENWIMSCRVLKRGMEHFVLNTIIDSAIQNGCSKIQGEYIPTAKNGMVKDHYANLGFKKQGPFWLMETKNYSIKKTHVQKLIETF